MIKWFTRWIWLLFVALNVNATTFYLAQTATGDGSGSSTGNRMALATINSSWTLSAGDVLSLGGTLTNQLTIGASGTAGNPITIYFEPNAKLSVTNWPLGAIRVNTQNYISIDGGSNGVIEATATGSGLTYQTGSMGIYASSASHLTVENLVIQNMYIRTSTNDQSGGVGGAQGVAIGNYCNVYPYWFSDFTVSNCVLRDTGSGITVTYIGVCSNFTIIGNTISRCNWAMNCADQDTNSAMLNVVFAKNHLYSFTNWDDPIGNYFHHDGFFPWSIHGGIIRDMKIYDNVIGPDLGPYCTAGIYLSCETVNSFTNILIYNNLFLGNPGESVADGLIFAWRVSGVQILNNTFLHGGSSIAINFGTNGGVNVIKGNIDSGGATFYNADYGTGNLLMDSNIIYNLPSDYAYSFASGGSQGYTTLAGAQSLGYELHTVNTNPLVNSDGTLQAASPAIGAGANFYNLFTVDKAGNSRPATGPWTIGAFQTGTNNPIVNSLNLPMIINIITQ
jgi:hypothetical protein